MMMNRIFNTVHILKSKYRFFVPSVVLVSSIATAASFYEGLPPFKEHNPPLPDSSTEKEKALKRQEQINRIQAAIGEAHLHQTNQTLKLKNYKFDHYITDVLYHNNVEPNPHSFDQILDVIEGLSATYKGDIQQKIDFHLQGSGVPQRKSDFGSMASMGNILDRSLEQIPVEKLSYYPLERVVKIASNEAVPLPIRMDMILSLASVMEKGNRDVNLKLLNSGIVSTFEFYINRRYNQIALSKSLKKVSSLIDPSDKQLHLSDMEKPIYYKYSKVDKEKGPFSSVFEYTVPTFITSLSYTYYRTRNIFMGLRTGVGISLMMAAFKSYIVVAGIASDKVWDIMSPTNAGFVTFTGFLFSLYCPYYTTLNGFYRRTPNAIGSFLWSLPAIGFYSMYLTPHHSSVFAPGRELYTTKPCIENIDPKNTVFVKSDPLQNPINYSDYPIGLLNQKHRYVYDKNL